jgi:hypothetical protein
LFTIHVKAYLRIANQLNKKNKAKKYIFFHEL